MIWNRNSASRKQQSAAVGTGKLFLNSFKEKFGCTGKYLILFPDNIQTGFQLRFQRAEAQVAGTGHIDEFVESHPDVAACQPKIRSLREPEKFEYAGAAGGFIDRYGYPFCRGRLFGTLETDRGQYDDPLDIFWASGAALFVRTAVYREVGGLDPGFFAHMEEIDLCWRIHLAGYRIAVVPQSRVHHQGGASLDAANPQKTYLNFRNNLLMLHKNLPRQEGKKVLFIRRLYDTLAFARFVALGQIPHARAILKAHNDFRKMRKQYSRHPQENLLNTFPEARRNITMEYFLKGKKKF